MNGQVLDYDAAYRAGATVVGAKAWNLARLHRYGFNVPRGGAIAGAWYRELMDRPHLGERAARLREVSALATGEAEVQEALAEFAAAICRESLPEELLGGIREFLRDHDLAERPLAVRSSAIGEDGPQTSFAGIHDSTLNVVGMDQVARAVLNCYASLWTPRALAYRRRMNVPDESIACGVVMCEMVAGPTGRPLAAGVAFSCEPRTGRHDVIAVNLAAESGEAVVRGDVTPDEYLLDGRDPTTILERRQVARALLTDEQLATLGRVVWRIHWDLGDGQDPQDVEWAFDGEQFWILQARPVTRLPRQTFAPIAEIPPIWSNANIKDSLPDPASMITWSMIAGTVRQVLFASLEAAGYELPEGIQVMRAFDGRYYFDLTALQWGMYDGFGITPADVNRTMGGFQPEISVPAGDPMQGAAGRQRNRRRLRLLMSLARFRRRLPADIADVFAANRRARNDDLTQLTDAELLNEFERRLALGNGFLPRLQLAAAYYGSWLTVLEDWLLRVTGDRRQSLITRLLAGTEGVASAEHGYRLFELAQIARSDDQAREALTSGGDWRALPAENVFRQAFETYLETFGHRGVVEMDFASPRWRDDPTYLLRQIAGMLETAADNDPRVRARNVRQAAEAELGGLPWHARPVARWLLARARHGAVLRESAKSAAAAAVESLQLLLKEVGRRLVQRGQLDSADGVFHFAIVDIQCLLRGEVRASGIKPLVADRQAQLVRWRAANPPDVIFTAARATAALAPQVFVPDAGTTRWQGVGAAPGKATGQACLLQTAHDGQRLIAGGVLVAPSTDPGWTPLFLRASAIVMETGGYLSHGAIVAREFGIPAVVNLPGIRVTLVEGELLCVDGDRGEVHRLGAQETATSTSERRSSAHT